MNIDRMPGELLPEARIEGSWIGGKGTKGLAEANEMWNKEMLSRKGEGRDPWTIEGVIDGKVVYRDKSIGGNVPGNMNEIPSGKKDEVSYSVVAYRIAA